MYFAVKSVSPSLPIICPYPDTQLPSGASSGLKRRCIGSGLGSGIAPRGAVSICYFYACVSASNRMRLIYEAHINPTLVAALENLFLTVSVDSIIYAC